MSAELDRLAALAGDELVGQGVPRSDIAIVRRAHLKYEGTDTSLAVSASDEDRCGPRSRRPTAPASPFSCPTALSSSKRSPWRPLARPEGDVAFASSPRAPAARRQPAAMTRVYTCGAWHDAPVFVRDDLALGQTVDGPAVLAERNATTVVEPGWRARVTAENHLVLERHLPRDARVAAGTDVDPVMLEVYGSLFMSIAEQMGQRLANTAHSVTSKERLDFSCALFDSSGNLVANAPHVPVHLGSMSESIRTVIRKNAGRMRSGDAYLLNDPYNGGTHLPDVTVVLPVFDEADRGILFYVAARGHHADIGGITPGSMPPNSRSVDDEGILIDNFQIVSSGRFREAELRALLASSPHPARNPEQNVADARAQIAACEKGREELLEMVRRFGLPSVTAYMAHVQDNAEENVRRAIGALHDGEFTCRMDGGSVVRVRVTVDHAARRAKVDFTGTSPELANNFNAPPAVVHAAVLYVFRTLVDADIPMNAGCLRPIDVVIPEGSMLSPRRPAATVAGNVETSQCVTDALYGALGVLAGSQGTMNNFTFGDDRYQYYETIAGGSGAGPGFDGTAAVQTHMTNSRITDPEVLELRYPVLVEEHSIRAGSGGAGQWRGGDGALRRVRFLRPMTAANLAGRRLVAPHGLAGGASGEVGATWVDRVDGSRQVLGYAEETGVAAGVVFVVSTPSGGGYGAPR